MAYNGSVELISGITPKNNQDFPLVDAKDVRVDDETRLDDALTGLKDDLNYKVPMSRNTIASDTDINTLKQPGVYSVTTDVIAETLSNWPDSRRGELVIFNSRGSNESYGYGVIQLVCSYTGLTYIRRYISNTTGWSAWIKFADDSVVQNTSASVSDLIEANIYKAVRSRDTISTGLDIDTLKQPGVYSVTTDVIAESLSNLPTNVACDIVVFNSRGSNESYGYGDIQIVVTNERIWFRQWKNSRWFEWIALANNSLIGWIDRNFINFNQYNLVKKLSRPYHINRTNNGITFMCDRSDEFLRWSIDGTATAIATATLMSGTLSDIGLVSGKLYYMNIDNYPEGLRLSIRFDTSGGNKFLEFSHSQYFVVPTTVTGELLIQFLVDAGMEYADETFNTPAIYPVNDDSLDEHHTWFLKGVILSDGTISSTDSRIYTPDYMQFDEDTVLSFDDTRGVQIMYYDNNDALIADRNTYGWMDTEANYVVINRGDRFRLNVKLVPNASQSNAQITETMEHVHIWSLSKKIKEDYKNYDSDWASMAMFQTISVIGDSFASGVLNNYLMSWGQILGRDIGATVINLSHGGAYTKTWLTNNDWGLPKMLNDDPQQLYICAMGINDYTRIKNNEYTLGTIADINANPSLNPDTFYGNYGKIISNILTHSPNACIVMLSVARPYERAMDPSIQEIAEYFNIPYIYLPDDWFFRSQYWRDLMVSDHPRAYGYSGMAKAIRRLIEKAIRKEKDYFTNYTGIVE